MKIYSWNVNSLRSAEAEVIDLLTNLHPDILMIQELRATPDQLPFFLKTIPGYAYLFNDSGRPGYGGTAVYYKDSLPFTNVTNTTGNELLNREGRTVQMEYKGIVFLNYYVPNGNSSPERLKYKMDFHQEMTSYAAQLTEAGKHVIVGGDLNVCHTEDDLYNPAATIKISGFLPKEQEWFTHFLNTGYTDSLRLFHKGKGHYTWWHMRDPSRGENKGMRFDYFLVANSLKNEIKSAKTHKEIYGSDHCPISLDIDI